MIRAAVPVLLGVLLLYSACSPQPGYVVLIDSLYAAAHEPGSIDATLKSLSRTSGVSIQGIVIPTDPGPELIRKLPLAGATVVLTPLLAPDARRFSAAFPAARLALIGGPPAGSPAGSQTAVRFDRTGAMKSAGEAFARYIDSRSASAPGAHAAPGWVLFLVDSAGRRSDLESFKAGVAAGGGSAVGDNVRYLVYSAPPGRDELRSVVQEAKGAHAVCYALFVGSSNAYCMDLLVGTDAKVIVPNRMGTEAYSDRILCSVDEPLRAALAAVIRDGKMLPPAIDVPAELSYPAGSPAPVKF